jgi:hypothetical protein
MDEGTVVFNLSLSVRFLGGGLIRVFGMWV